MLSQLQAEEIKPEIGDDKEEYVDMGGEVIVRGKAYEKGFSPCVKIAKKVADRDAVVEKLDKQQGSRLDSGWSREASGSVIETSNVPLTTQYQMVKATVDENPGGPVVFESDDDGSWMQGEHGAWMHLGDGSKEEDDYSEGDYGAEAMKETKEIERRIEMLSQHDLMP